MNRIRWIFMSTYYNFFQWRGNMRVVVTFILAFILCFLLSDKTMRFALECETTLQLVESFVWTFSDSNSILLASLLLLLLFADMPFITSATPFFLVRGNRKTWVISQLLYIALSTAIYLSFVLVSTCVLCLRLSFTKNTWSKTAAILAYSGEGKHIAIPATVKVLEMSRPYGAMANIFLLILLYALVMVFIMMFFNLLKGPLAGVIAALAFSAYGLLLNPDNLQKLFNLPDVLYYKARVWIGWLSPLNHATYGMHDFGYDNLPTMLETCLIFGGILIVLVIGVIWRMHLFNFVFKGTEN